MSRTLLGVICGLVFGDKAKGRRSLRGRQANNGAQTFDSGGSLS